MNKPVILSFLLLAVFMMNFDYKAVAQEEYNLKMQKAEGKTIVCYGSDENSHTRIPASAYLLRKIAAKKNNRMLMASSIEVEYKGFTPEAQAAFQRAVDIWAVLLESPVPIKIEANFGVLDEGVLGSASTTAYYRNFHGAPHVNTWYPIALAEKITSEELNESSEPDIVVYFNSDNDWYYGLDANPPQNMYDFVSVVLHELAHGLGFSSTFYEENGTGIYGFSGLPLTYDHFIENGSGDQLTDFIKYSNPSTELGSQITSNNLYFNSPLAINKLGVRPQIYAPSPYEQGSSMSHLDESQYPAGSASSLMTPQIGKSEAVHNPGVSMSLLHDLGWLHTYIVHEPLRDREDDVNDILIQAQVYSDTTFDGAAVKVHYSTDKFETSESVVLTNEANTNNYTGYIPAQPLGTYVAYYIEVEETTGRKPTIPGSAPNYYYAFNVAPDSKAPEISHTPLEFFLSSDERVTLKASVFDNMGLENVSLELKVNDVAYATYDMVNISDYSYEYELVLNENLTASNGDLVQYRIIATDISNQGNIAYFPETGYQEFLVDDIGEARASYQSDFNSIELSKKDFLGGSSFSIKTEAEFESPAIHSVHPYANGTNEKLESNIIYQLKYPILIDESNPYMSFKEVVLVEPGESGAIHTEQGFYDYVIVEASSDGGESWSPLAPGYDSSNKPAWSSRFESSISPDPDNEGVSNSSAKGDQSLYYIRIINLSTNYSDGDEIMIRFRLYSDQLVYGWGWAIDDLNIQGDQVLSADDEILNSISVYPNPTNGKLQLGLNVSSLKKDIQVEVIDRLGRVKLQKAISVKASKEEFQLNLGNLSSGLYFIKLITEDKESIHKVVLTN